jgi:hypothetical protein
MGGAKRRHILEIITYRWENVFVGVESGVTLLKNKLLLGLAATSGFLLCEEE